MPKIRARKPANPQLNKKKLKGVGPKSKAIAKDAQKAEMSAKKATPTPTEKLADDQELAQIETAQSQAQANQDDATATASGLGAVTATDAVSAAETEIAKKEKKKHKKHHKHKSKKDQPEDLSNANGKGRELTEKDLAKIAKKKAKKLAKKLKKKEAKRLATDAGGDGEAKEKQDAQVEQQKAQEEITVEGEAVKKAEETIEEAKDSKLSPSAASGSKQLNTKKRGGKANIEEGETEKVGPRSKSPLAAATVFVGNLPINTKRVQIMRLFQEHGPVQSIRIRTAGGKNIFKHKQRKEAGTLNAYVVLKDAATAKLALALNGCEFKGNHLRITSSDSDITSGITDADAKRMIFVGNLKYSATEEKLRDIFSSCGEIEYVRCIREGAKECKGVAYVSFKTPDAVGLAMELNETMLDDRPIHVERYSLKKVGAKKARDAAGTTATTVGKRGPQRRTAPKRLTAKSKQQKPKAAAAVKGNKEKPKGGRAAAPKVGAADTTKKKSKYRGVKVGVIAKKKQRKINSIMHAMAKKIAPKTK